MLSRFINSDCLYCPRVRTTSSRFHASGFLPLSRLTLKPTVRSAQCESPHSSHTGSASNFSIGSSFQTLVIQMSLLCRRWKVVAGISVSAVRTTPGRVEMWRGGVGAAYLLPALSSAGASLASPCSVTTSRSSNRTGGSPASGSRRSHAFAHGKLAVRTQRRASLRAPWRVVSGYRLDAAPRSLFLAHSH
jgi:hypothetical protein